MNKELSSIFVSVEVAKLAKEKGFNEWCVWLHSDIVGYVPNSGPNDYWNFEWGDLVFCLIPTHYQLIEWLSKTHKIDICLFRKGAYMVYNDNNSIEEGLEDMFEINEALTIALNQVKNK